MPIVASKPTNFRHVIHLQVDLDSEFGIKGLPDEWKKRFANADVSAKEVAANPTAMIQIINGLEQ